MQVVEDGIMHSIADLQPSVKRGFYNVALLGYSMSIISIFLEFIDGLGKVLAEFISYAFILILWYRLHYWLNDVFTWIFRVNVTIILGILSLIILNRLAIILEGTHLLSVLGIPVALAIIVLTLAEVILELVGFKVLYESTNISYFNAVLYLLAASIVLDALGATFWFIRLFSNIMKITAYVNIIVGFNKILRVS